MNQQQEATSNQPRGNIATIIRPAAKPRQSNKEAAANKFAIQQRNCNESAGKQQEGSNSEPTAHQTGSGAMATNKKKQQRNHLQNSSETAATQQDSNQEPKREPTEIQPKTSSEPTGNKCRNQHHQVGPKQRQSNRRPTYLQYSSQIAMS